MQLLSSADRTRVCWRVSILNKSGDLVKFLRWYFWLRMSLEWLLLFRVSQAPAPSPMRFITHPLSDYIRWQHRQEERQRGQDEAEIGDQGEDHPLSRRVTLWQLTRGPRFLFSFKHSRDASLPENISLIITSLSDKRKQPNPKPRSRCEDSMAWDCNYFAHRESPFIYSSSNTSGSNFSRCEITCSTPEMSSIPLVEEKCFMTWQIGN
jgi:hypothetical protein